MFKLEPNPTFKAKVAIPVPGSPVGKSTLEIEFRHKTKAALQAYLESTTTNARDDIDALAEIIVGWHDIDVDYNRDNLATLLQNYPAAAPAIVSAYVKELADARLGN